MRRKEVKPQITARNYFKEKGICSKLTWQHQGRVTKHTPALQPNLYENSNQTQRGVRTSMRKRKCGWVVFQPPPWAGGGTENLSVRTQIKSIRIKKSKAFLTEGSLRHLVKYHSWNPVPTWRRCQTSHTEQLVKNRRKGAHRWRG